MRIGILTTARSYLLSNSGSFWQHYALRLVLKRAGHTPFRLTRQGERNFWLLQGVVLLRTLLSVHKRWSRSSGIGRNTFLCLENTLRFAHSYHSLIGPINERQTPADCFIAGSDQVWTEWSADSSLSKVPAESPKIAYAASADWVSCEGHPRWKKDAAYILPTFEAISVRERAGQKLCQSLIGDSRQVAHLCDPVLLLNRSEYEHLISRTGRIFKVPTLFCYLVNISSDHDFSLSELENIARKRNLDLKIAGIQGSEAFIPKKYRIDLGPLDFLRCYRDAECVITNSFHGTVFSLIFNRPFITLEQSNRKGTNQNTRQFELLEEVGLQERFYKIESLSISGEERGDFKWDRVNERLSAWKGVSLKWLVDHL